jgi:hypothetical protein
MVLDDLLSIMRSMHGVNRQCYIKHIKHYKILNKDVQRTLAPQRHLPLTLGISMRQVLVGEATNGRPRFKYRELLLQSLLKSRFFAAFQKRTASSTGMCALGYLPEARTRLP